MSVSESPHDSFCPSPKNEYSFLNRSFFTRDWLCLCEESHSKSFLLIKSLCSTEVRIFYWEESYAFTGFFLSYWKDWFSSKTVNYTEKNLILFGFIFFLTYNKHNIKLAHIFIMYASSYQWATTSTSTVSKTCTVYHLIFCIL